MFIKEKQIISILGICLLLPQEALQKQLKEGRDPFPESW